MRQSVVASVAVMAAAALLGACGQSQTTISTPAGTVTTKQNGATASVTVKTQKGTASFQAGGGLPSGFPHAVPLPSTGHLSSAIRESSNGSSAYLVSYGLNVSLPAGLSAYDAKLSSAGFRESSNLETSGSSGATSGALQSWTSSAWIIAVVGASATQSSSASLTITVRAATSG